MSDAGSIIAGHDGYVFNTAGDSFAVAFDRAGDALATAVDAPSMLGAEHWPGPSIRVRMGLHAGEVEERDGDFFGPAVNSAARVCAACHGGQILLTAAVDALVDTDRIDLGGHRCGTSLSPRSCSRSEPRVWRRSSAGAEPASPGVPRPRTGRVSACDGSDPSCHR